MEVKRIFDLLERYRELYSSKDKVLCSKYDGKWVCLSPQEYIDTSHQVAAGLIAIGVEKGDKIVSISNNSIEWNCLDMGIMLSGAVHVPVYPTISDSDYEYILHHSETRLVFVASVELYNRIQNIVKSNSLNISIYCIRKCSDIPSLADIIEKGKNSDSQVHSVIREVKENTDENSLVTIIYTSGTTGNPKGVMLSHKNIVSNFKATSVIPPYGMEAKTLSFLPLCHIYERMMNYMYQYNGYTVYYAESLATIADNIREVQPEIITTVPRLLESIFDKIINKGHKLKGFRKKIFFWALQLGFKYEIKGRSLMYNLKLSIARKLVFSKWKEALGGKLDIIVSGGAALQPRLGRIFTAAGFRVLEGYGLTETSPVIAVSNFEKNGIAFGTVGPILKGTEVKISDEGEILCKGPNVMLGYYKDEELTREAIDEDGWFHTGDLGLITPEGQLKITGRKKEMFKTSAGKYIVPQTIENKLKESPFIQHAIVVGENKKFAAALIVPNFENIKEWCERKGIDYKGKEHIAQQPEIRKRIQKVIDNINSVLGVYEQIVKFEIISDEWSVLSKELTPSMKLRRNYIIEKYADTLKRIYKEE